MGTKPLLQDIKGAGFQVRGKLAPPLLPARTEPSTVCWHSPAGSLWWPPTP